MKDNRGPRLDLPATLGGLTERLARRGEAPALVQLQREGREDWSCARLADKAGRLAAALRAAGVAPGERAILFGPNSPRWVVACLGLLRAGAIPVPVDSQADGADLRHILTDSGARWAFTAERLAPAIAEQAPQDGPRQVLLDGRGEGAEVLEQLLARGEGPPPDLDADPHAEAVLFYTSGTSGAPKGVPLTRANLLSNLKAILSQNLVGPDDRLLLPLPLHHVYAFALGMLAPLNLGIPVILPHSLTGPQLVRALREGEATAMLGIPRLYTALFDGIRQRTAVAGGVGTAAFDGLLRVCVASSRRLRLDIGRLLFRPLRRRFAPRLRLLVSGGAALDEGLAWRLTGLGWTVATGYGLTETSPILTFVPPGVRRFDTAGKPLPGVELRIGARGNGADVGEVEARGPNVFSGWLGLPEKTREALSEDGWFRTGDLGRIDMHHGEPWLRLSGRASSRIVLSGGENVDPERLEERLAGAASVREVGVLERDGALAALVVPEPAALRAHEGEDLRRQVQEEISQALQGAPSFQRIGKVRLDASPLPRTRLGKLRRQRLAERFEAAAEEPSAAIQPGLAPREELAPEDRQLIEDPTAGAVWEWLGERFPGQPIRPDTDLGLDLDVDSLEWVSLTMDLQDRLGLALPEEAIGRVERVRDLLREAAEIEQAQTGGASLKERLKDPESTLETDQRRWLDPPGTLPRLLGGLIHRLSRWAMRGLFRLEVTGLEHLPRDGPCLLTPNHLSVLDPAVVLAAIDPQRRRTTCWGGWTGLLFHRPWTRLLSRSLRVLPVDPARNPLSSLAFGAAALERGCMLVWFPEGTRSKDGTLQPFRAGVGQLAQGRQIPVVPARIEGTYEALPAGRLLPRVRRLRLHIGAPVEPEALEREGRGDGPAECISDALHERVQHL